MWAKKSPKGSMTRRSFLGRLAGATAAACITFDIPLSALPTQVRHRAADDAFQKFVKVYESKQVDYYDYTTQRYEPHPMSQSRDGFIARVSPDFCDDLTQCPADKIESWTYRGAEIPEIPFREYKNVMIITDPALKWGEIRFERA